MGIIHKGKSFTSIYHKGIEIIKVLYKGLITFIKGEDFDFKTGLVASWQFENNFNDYLGNHDASLIGSATFVNGVVNTGINLVGVSDIITVPNNDVFSFTDGLSDTKMSISFWVNFDSILAFSYIINKRGLSNNFE